jgi:hypothetical protein
MAKQKLAGAFSTEHQLFNDLDKYLEFCVEYGYPYNPSTVYDMRAVACRQFNKWMQGKDARNNWIEDAKAFNG